MAAASSSTERDSGESDSDIEGDRGTTQQYWERPPALQVHGNQRSAYNPIPGPFVIGPIRRDLRNELVVDIIGECFKNFEVTISYPTQRLGIAIWVEWHQGQRRILAVVNGTSGTQGSGVFAIRIAVTGWTKCDAGMRRPLCPAPGMDDLVF